MRSYRAEDRACEVLARHQYGVFSRRQALQTGHSSRSIGDRTSSDSGGSSTPAPTR